jgi:hypothetical protein
VVALGAAGPAQAAPFEIGQIPACTELVPAAVAPTNAPVRLDVRVLLDGTSQARAATIFQEAARSYFTLGITLALTYQTVSFSGTEASGLIAQSKAFFGGSRPPGTDVVYTFTNKDMTEAGLGNAVAGLADCIGGVAFPDRAFAVGEDLADFPLRVGPLRTGTQVAGHVAAHEIGHLMGAHHHYANCVQNVVPATRNDNPCTLMFNDVSLTGRAFSALNSLTVRGHAQLYARP